MPVQSARSISLSCDAGQDLPLRRFCSMSATGLVLGPDQGGGANSEISVIGVSLETYDDSEHTAGNASNVIPVALLDGAVLEVEASAEDLAVGDAITTDAAGQAKIANLDADEVLGVAISVTTEAGEILTFIGMKAGRQATTA